MARIKYYDNEKNNWEYADLGGSATSEDKWELIETVTTTEQNAEFRRTQEPDGTPYNFKKIRVYFSREKETKIRYLYVTVGNRDVTRLEWEAKATEAIITAENEGGQMSVFSGLSEDPLTDYDMRMTGYFYLHSPVGNITKVHSYLGLASGTKIEIWAIRA